jgi:hypothetical protein
MTAIHSMVGERSVLPGKAELMLDSHNEGKAKFARAAEAPAPAQLWLALAIIAVAKFYKLPRVIPRC